MNELCTIISEAMQDTIEQVDWCLQQPEARQIAGAQWTRILLVRHVMEDLRQELETVPVETTDTGEG